jgi:hypothetical protein
LRGLLLALTLPLWAAIWLSALPLPLQVLFSIAVAAQLVLQLRNHCGSWGGARCDGLRWDGGGWWWRDRSGGENQARLRHATLWPGLLVLNFLDNAGRRRALVLLPDSAAADELRRLRVYLRHADVFG